MPGIYVYLEDVADLAVGLMIDVLRKVSATDRYVRKGLWPSKGDFPLGSKMGSKRVGILGIGSIGQEVAKRVEAFGCRISYSSRNKKPLVSYPYYSNLSQLALDSDVLIVCCGLTDQTRHMINKEVMLALGKEGVIINIGRGAGLDVFENEPNIPTQLLTLDNVLSPHRAVHTPESLAAMYELVKGNFEAFFSNKPLLSPIANQ
ncbi:hypothetical protein FH972_001827 [Carpinus fangiana]|uniref:glyoxylate reductase (NADP(+)) n=1 Tax=Carpinus fangiana TaxID=176857 RepID=A0A5N6QFC6_9ROSI|nr:hypothetical protein FH972_001827 [Carpinus fangiana]